MSNEKSQLSIALSTVLSTDKNVTTFIKNIRAQASNERELYRFVYQIIGDILVDKKGLKQYLRNVKTKQVGWKHPCFHSIDERINEHDNYIVKPFEVAEGVVRCPSCGKNRTWSIQKQTRSSDEPMTTFSKCVDCGYEWSYSG